MAVFRNYYNRRWSVTVTCLFLLCSTIDCTLTVNGERVRHHHHGKQQQQQEDQEDVYVGQLERAARCPNCVGKGVPVHQNNPTDTDGLRLEAIKRQILSKLGLRQKPNVTHHLPKEVVMQTLYRAEDSRDFFGNGSGEAAGDGREDVTSTTSARSAGGQDQMDVDDFYGRTSEIISFAEKGESSRRSSATVHAKRDDGPKSPQVTGKTVDMHVMFSTLRLHSSKKASVDPMTFNSRSGLKKKRNLAIEDHPLHRERSEESPRNVRVQHKSCRQQLHPQRNRNRRLDTKINPQLRRHQTLIRRRVDSPLAPVHFFRRPFVWCKVMSARNRPDRRGSGSIGGEVSQEI